MTTKEFIEVFDTITEAPGGIDQLRELVLQLAVQGKLVPQDPNDEPASKLLKRIAAAKARTSRKGRVKVRKVVDPALTRLNYHLPSGWASAHLSDLTQVLNGRAYKKSELLLEGTPVLRVGNLFTSNQWYYSDLDLDKDKYCEEGDLIYAWSASFGPFIWRGPKVIYHYHIWKLSLFSEIDLRKQYLYNVLLQKTQDIKNAGHGISMVHLTKEKMEQLVVPLPPLAEQHRIVAKINELMGLIDRLENSRCSREAVRTAARNSALAALCNAATPAEVEAAWTRIAEQVEDLFTTPDDLTPLREAVLQLAVRGRLVPQDPGEEPAANLLRRAKTSKSREIIERKIRRNSEPELSESAGEVSSPTHWVWTHLYDFALVLGGKRLPAGASFSTENTGNIYIRVTDMKDGSISTENLQYISDDVRDRIAKYTIDREDLYITIAGTIGDVGEVPRHFHGQNLTENAAKIVFREVDKKFLLLVLRSGDVQEQFQENIKQMAQPKLALKRISGARVPIPPLAEQHRIVAKVNELMGLIDQLEQHLSVSEKHNATFISAAVNYINTQDEKMLHQASDISFGASIVSK
ncbi:MAG: restriction endonuclease subunit S [Rhodothermaceae bacterium]|nr:restriction endonuclease subunit S [Rhodothermaceae bacterium]